MNVVRYEPWSALERLRGEVDRLFSNGGFAAGGDGDRSRVVTSHWAPAVDIKEEGDRYVLKADVPGVDAKDIEITMERGLLAIKGERKREDSEEHDGYKRVERSVGTFYRRFSLPESADAQGITATSKDGVLEITIPKQERLQPRRIAVN